MTTTGIQGHARSQLMLSTDLPHMKRNFERQKSYLGFLRQFGIRKGRPMLATSVRPVWPAPMSALGHQRKSRTKILTSALPPRADINREKADIGHCRQRPVRSKSQISGSVRRAVSSTLRAALIRPPPPQITTGGGQPVPSHGPRSARITASASVRS